MSRAKGHNGAAVALLEQEEDSHFAFVRTDQDLRLIELRVKQALKRGGPKELLEPALDLIDEIRVRLNRIKRKEELTQ